MSYDIGGINIETKEDFMQKKTKMIVTLVSSIVGLAVMVFISIQLNSSEIEAAEEYTIYQVGTTDPLVFSGTVKAENTESIYLDTILGEITEIHVKDGQSVANGDALITYENDAIKGEITEAKRTQERSVTNISNAKEDITLVTERKNKAEQQLNNVKKELNNLKSDDAEYDLKKSELEQRISQSEVSVESEEETIRALERTLKEYEADLADIDANITSLEKSATTTVMASTDGVALLQGAGKTDATVPFIQVISEAVVVVGEVSQYDYDALSIDQKVTVKLVSTNEEIEGSIVSIDTLASSELENSGTTTYQFTVAVEQSIQYGFSVQIGLSTEKLVIPESAMVESDEKEVVYIYENGIVNEREIVTKYEDGLIIVVEGLAKGDQIIESPNEELEDGQEVMVIE